MAINKNVAEYANARIGIYFPGFPDSLTGQCVSLTKWYIGEMCGVSDWQAARGNAKDFGDTLVNQGLATVVSSANRRRGDIVVWKSDGGGYGHIGVLCSGDNVFEENVGLKGVPSAVYGGNTVHPSRLDPLSASWRVGSPTFYRMNGYSEVVTATADQVRQDYLEILERGADDGGLAHYTTNGMTNDQVWADLLKSDEYQKLQAHKQAVAQAATEAQAAADAKAKADAEAATQAALDAQAAQQTPQPAYVPEIPTTPITASPTLYDWLAELVKVVINWLKQWKKS